MSKHLCSLGLNLNKATLRRLGASGVQIFFVLMLAFSLIGVSPSEVSAAGATYYVDNSDLSACVDSSAGGSATKPFCTITHAAAVAEAGDTVIVRAGTYAETIYPNNSGTLDAPITYHGETGAIVTGRPAIAGSNYPGFGLSTKSYIVIEGFTVTNTSGHGIEANLSDHITISNNTVSYAGTTAVGGPSYMEGIILNGTTYSTITGNTVEHNTCIGIRLHRGSDYNLVSNNNSSHNFSEVETDAAGIALTGSSHNTVLRNTVYQNEDSGINVYIFRSADGLTVLQSTDNYIISNLTYANGDHGIDTNNSPHNTYIGNTIQGNGTVGINFEGDTAETGSFGSTVMNNIFYQNGYHPPSISFPGNLRVDDYSKTDTVVDYNIYYKGEPPSEPTHPYYQLLWGKKGDGTAAKYDTLELFKAGMGAGQEAHGIELISASDPLFITPVTPVIRNLDKNVPYVPTNEVGDFNLEPKSKAIDSANAAAYPIDSNSVNLGTTDILGNARVDVPSMPNNGAGNPLYGDRGAFEYQPNLPVVTTQPVTAIGKTGATAHGTVTALGSPNPSQHGVVWGTASGPTIAGNKTTNGAVSATGPFSGSITGLTPGLTYYVRAYATNDNDGTVYGNEVTFVPLATDIITQPVTNVTITSAQLNGNLASLGSSSPTDYGFTWGTSANPTIAGTHKSFGAPSGTGAFTFTLTGLKPGTTYHIRAYVVNAVETSYGADITFNTNFTILLPFMRK